MVMSTFKLTNGMVDVYPNEDEAGMYVMTSHAYSGKFS
jgi:hypothetical protein